MYSVQDLALRLADSSSSLFPLAFSAALSIVRTAVCTRSRRASSRDESCCRTRLSNARMNAGYGIGELIDE